jgi:hypothetical protein
MRRLSGLVLLILAGLASPLVPVVIGWAILECGPANSSCHHAPYRLAVAMTVWAATIGFGFWLVLAPSLSSEPLRGRRQGDIGKRRV